MSSYIEDDSLAFWNENDDLLDDIKADISEDEVIQQILFLDKVIDGMDKKKDWKQILFSEWEMQPFKELFFIRLCEDDKKFSENIVKDVTDYFHDHIRYQVNDDANINFIVLGTQGSAKSTLNFAIFLEYKQRHNQLKNRQVPNPRLTWQHSETLRGYNEAQNFECIIQDEEDIETGTGSQNRNYHLGNLIKRAREYGISLIKSCPELTSIEGCDLALVPFGVYKIGKRDFKRYDDVSECYTRIMVYEKHRLKSQTRWHLLGHAKIYVGDAIEYMKNEFNYKEKKELSWLKIKESMGVANSIDNEYKFMIDEKAEILAIAAHRYHWDGRSKNDLESFIRLEDIKFENDDERDDIKVLAIQKYKEKYKKEAKTEDETINFDEDFSFDVEEILDQVKILDIKDHINLERDVLIYRYMIHHEDMTNSQLEDHYKKRYNLERSSFSLIRKKIRGHISLIVGHLFEKYLEQQYKKDENIKEVICDGGTGEIDIKLIYNDEKIEYISAKCLYFTRKSYSLNLDEFHPEIIACQKDREKNINSDVTAVINNLANNKQYIYRFSDEEIKNYKKKSKKTILLHF